MSIRGAAGVFTMILVIGGSPHALAGAPQDPAVPHTQHAGHQSGIAAGSSRDASGTAWQPDDTPMYGAMFDWRGWKVMLHGSAFAQWLYEPGDIHRTGGFSTHQFGSGNWGMGTLRRAVGTGTIGLRTMISLEPVTLTGCGAINLLATGEMCDGDTIHDRQHPHDLFMEVAADYDRPLRGSVRWQLYGGLAGEPALGPPAFPHRLSASPNPIAPISHHWLDSSHITFGVVTNGFYTSRWKAEVSVFNGREPDEHRADFDLGALDSVSGRLSFAPSSRLSLQVSAGHLREAEAEFAPQPRADLDRFTASAMYHRPFATDSMWATTVAYGVNAGEENIPEGVFEATTQAWLGETMISLGDRHVWFGRGEVVEKPAHDLHAHEFSSRIFTVGKLQAGYVRYWQASHGAMIGAGATASASLVPSELASRYGGRVAPGAGIFLSIRPSRHGG